MIDNLFSEIEETKKADIKVKPTKENLIALALLVYPLYERKFYVKISFSDEFMVNGRKFSIKQALEFHNKYALNKRKDLIFLLTKQGVEPKKGLAIPGIFTRPLIKSLEQSFFIYIPGVTADSRGVKKFLRESNLDPQKAWIKFSDLSDKDKDKLVTNIILRRMDLELIKDAENVLMDHYLLGENLFDDLILLDLALDALIEKKEYHYAFGLLMKRQRSLDIATQYLNNYLEKVSSILKEFFEGKIERIEKHNTIFALFKEHNIGLERAIEIIHKETGKTIIGVFPKRNKSLVIAAGNYKKFLPVPRVEIDKDPKQVFEELPNKIRI
ncbi:NEQ104 [Nanoarchaeum equitans Kin4-M]|uniref:NEQ104 n=1 Tax=Nanoarchaeum equitans (strain Kin4-M) TaxID=228908 RepID=Q74MJ6_NANEQ|nr:NEQ104 [Nanoarchaeum equitans Kin4-M]